MTEEMKVVDSRGVPTMKALWLGIILDGDDPPNRHLKRAHLEGKELFLELVEVGYDPGEAAEGEEEDEDLVIDYFPVGLEDEEAEEPCPRYPDGCASCTDDVCNGPDSEIPDEDETYIVLEIAYREKASEEWTEFPEAEIATNPALLRFLNLVNDTHGL